MLLEILAQLQLELPEVEKSLGELAVVLSGSLPQSLKEILARYRGLVTATNYQEFDATVRESYADQEAFAAAQAQYGKARTVRDRAFHVSQMADYLHKACALDETIEFERTNLLHMLGFESLLHDPSLIGVPIRILEPLLRFLGAWQGLGLLSWMTSRLQLAILAPTTRAQQRRWLSTRSSRVSQNVLLRHLHGSMIPSTMSPRSGSLIRRTRM